MASLCARDVGARNGDRRVSRLAESLHVRPRAFLEPHGNVRGSRRSSSRTRAQGRLNWMRRASPLPVRDRPLPQERRREITSGIRCAATVRLHALDHQQRVALLLIDPAGCKPGEKSRMPVLGKSDSEHAPADHAPCPLLVEYRAGDRDDQAGLLLRKRRRRQWRRGRSRAHSPAVRSGRGSRPPPAHAEARPRRPLPATPSR